MHPNAELSLLTSLGETLFRTVVDVSGGGRGARWLPGGGVAFSSQAGWLGPVVCAVCGPASHCTHLFATTNLQQPPNAPPPETGATGGASSSESAVRAALRDYSDRLPPPFAVADIEGRVKDKTPYVVVALQEVGGAGRQGWLGAPEEGAAVETDRW
jgi:dynein heavy chain